VDLLTGFVSALRTCSFNAGIVKANAAFKILEKA
jgi:hypothetical protein